MSVGRDCLICWEPIEEDATNTTSSCGHGSQFHESCMEMWEMDYGGTCPLCRYAEVIDPIDTHTRTEHQPQHAARWIVSDSFVMAAAYTANYFGMWFVWLLVCVVADAGNHEGHPWYGVLICNLSIITIAVTLVMCWDHFCCIFTQCEYCVTLLGVTSGIGLKVTSIRDIC